MCKSILKYAILFEGLKCAIIYNANYNDSTNMPQPTLLPPHAAKRKVKGLVRSASPRNQAQLENPCFFSIFESNRHMTLQTSILAHPNSIGLDSFFLFFF